jgi:hypothetical protein
MYEEYGCFDPKAKTRHLLYNEATYGFFVARRKTSGPRAANRVLQNDTGTMNGSGQAPSDRVVIGTIESALVLQLK